MKGNVIAVISGAAFVAVMNFGEIVNEKEDTPVTVGKLGYFDEEVMITAITLQTIQNRVLKTSQTDPAKLMENMKTNKTENRK